MIIEFVGRPGTGKTTIAQGLHEAMKPRIDTLLQPLPTRPTAFRKAFRRILSRDYADNLYYSFILQTLFRDYPYIRLGVLRDYIKELARTEENANMVKLRSRLLTEDLVRHFSLQQGRVSKPVILEEGLAQRGAGAWLSGVSGVLVERHYATMPVADVYVVVDAPDGVVYDRLMTREGVQHRFMPREYTDVIRTALRSRGRLLVEVDGTRHPQESVALVRDCLNHYGIFDLPDGRSTQYGRRQ